MRPITELQRRTAPFPKPQAIFVDGGTLWLSFRQTKKFDAVDDDARRDLDRAVPAGDTAWGATKLGDDVDVVCGVDVVDVDTRVIRRVRPGVGFDPAFSLPCPDGMGSHISHDGTSLVLSQWYPQKLISIGAGTVSRVACLTRRIRWWAIATRKARSTSRRRPTKNRTTTSLSASIRRRGSARCWRGWVSQRVGWRLMAPIFGPITARRTEVVMFAPVG